MSSPAPCRLSPANPAGYTELLIRGRIDRALARTGDTARDRGASVVEWVIISALLVGIAVAVGTILFNTITTKANEINLDTSTP
jgi:hypothetical protein